MKSFNDTLTELLKKDSRFVDENNELIRAEIINGALKIDKDLISILLSNKEIKDKFFIEIKGHWIFEMNKFIDYIQDKNFLNDSYTKYKNKIGLSIGDKLLKEKREVALSFPFKDCILEGGQTKEEDKRKEIFFNEILAQDEIDRLLEPKVLTNFKRYTPKGEEKVNELKRDEKGIIKENLIIKGNNLLALHSIKKQFQGKIKLIYIDPPYNTGNDSFGYNDNFNHSTWLTFMKNRLEVAKELLSEKGAIFVQISDREIAYLHILMDEIFTREQFINKICIKVRAPTGFKIVNRGLFESAEYILIYGKKKDNWEYIPQYESCEYDENYKFIVVNKESLIKDWKIESISEYVSKKLGFKSSKEAIKKFGKSIFMSEVGKEALENCSKVFRFTAINNDAGKETLKAKAESLEKKDKIVIVERENKRNRLVLNGEIMTFYESKVRELDGIKTPTNLLTNIWTDIAWEGIAKEGGVILNKGKKPERLIKRIVEMSTNKGDIVLDYHFGSGTTGAVAHKMGRQYIGIEQINYEENGSVKRLKSVIGVEKDKGKLSPTIEDYDESGISKLINWKGGGDFVYCELARYNDDFIEKIYKAQNTKELLKIWEEMKEKSFINYNVDIKTAEEHLEEFKQLSTNKQKEILIQMLNKNQLYVNLSEIEDSHFKVDKEDKELNKQFYQGE